MLRKEKLQKLGSDTLLQVYDTYCTLQHRLSDSMHHCMQSKPESERKIKDVGENFNKERRAFLRKLLSSSKHPQVVKRFRICIERKLKQLKEIELELESSAKLDAKEDLTASMCCIHLQTLKGILEDINLKIS